MRMLCALLAFVLSIFSLLASITSALSNDEYNSLQDIYKCTNGQFWEWASEESFGVRWNFTGYDYNNPCADNWQGIVCSEAPDVCRTNVSAICNITELSLPGKS